MYYNNRRLFAVGPLFTLVNNVMSVQQVAGGSFNWRTKCDTIPKRRVHKIPTDKNGHTVHPDPQ